MILDFFKKHSFAFSVYHLIAFSFAFALWRLQKPFLFMTGAGILISIFEFLIDKFFCKGDYMNPKSEFTILVSNIMILIGTLAGLVSLKSWVILNFVFVPWNETAIYCAKRYNIKGGLFKDIDGFAGDALE